MSMYRDIRMALKMLRFAASGLPRVPPRKEIETMARRWVQLDATWIRIDKEALSGYVYYKCSCCGGYRQIPNRPLDIAPHDPDGAVWYSCNRCGKKGKIATSPWLMEMLGWK